MTEKKTDKLVKQTDLIKKENEQLKGIDESKAAQIKAVFQPMVEMLESFEEKYKEVTALKTSPDKCKQAKQLRIAVAKVRIEADKVRKIQKENSLREGKAIDGVNNILKFAVMDKEEKLKEIETHYERIEAEKKAQLQLDRVAELEKYEADGEFVDLGNMPDEVWKNYLAGVKNNYESVKEAERKAEEERIEAERKQTEYDQRLKALLPFGEYFDSSRLTLDSTEDDFEQIIMDAKTGRTAYLKEQEKIKADNERLKIEAEKAEKKRIADQKKAGAERKKQEQKLQAEREKAEAEKRIQDEIIRKEREAREKLEREAEAEADRKAAEEKKALAAPDKEKLFSVATKLRNTKTTVKSPVAKKALEDAAILIEKIAEAM